MIVTFSPQASMDWIDYSFDGDAITATYRGVTDVFDFTGLPDGVLALYDDLTGESLVESDLGVNPILYAEKTNGVLYVKLLNFITETATLMERFPKTFISDDYEKYKEELEDGKDELEEQQGNGTEETEGTAGEVPQEPKGEGREHSVGEVSY